MLRIVRPYKYAKISGNKDSILSIWEEKHTGSFKDKSHEFRRLVVASLQYGQILARIFPRELNP